MHIKIPKLSLVVLIGTSGSGKSTFARRHFAATEVLSSDYCRGLVSDDENSTAATTDAFDVLHFIGSKRLAAGKLTVVDATNVQPEARKPLVELARRYHVLPVAIVLNLPEDLCHERNRSRPDRAFGPHVIRNQRSQLRRSIRGLNREGFRHIFELESLEQVDAASIERQPLWNDRTSEHGPFDFIGDVHGCADELKDLLDRLGYLPSVPASHEPGWTNIAFLHPDGRKAVFVGDLVDRGPKVIESLSIVRNMMLAGSALCVPGNHDMKLLKKLNGRDVQITHGLANTLAEIDSLPTEVQPPFKKSLAEFLDGLVSHYVLDSGNLAVAHAGMKAEMQGRGSGRVRDFALYGETTGETDEFGLPVRHNWAAEYRGTATVVYGHTPVPEPEWLNRTINIDTGCVFGGSLTALRYPEKELVAVPARETYCEPSRPFLRPDQQAAPLTSQQLDDDVLDAEDVMGKRIISTRFERNITIREENATAALEVMSRWAANPKWLIYLPPTMSPCETSKEAGLLEHPAEAFAYYRNQGVPPVVCEEKHMGSRAVVVICRDAATARSRFGITERETGIIYTRTGRRFFNDPDLEQAFLERIRAAMTASDFWNDFQTTWACLDCELMPWSAKAQELLRSQYAAVGSAGSASLPVAVSVIEQTLGRLNGEAKEALGQLHTKMLQKQQAIGRFVTAYRQYCWTVNSLDDLKLAPFHLLATEGKVHVHQNHLWHMQTLAKVCEQDPGILLATNHKEIEVKVPFDKFEATSFGRVVTDAGPVEPKEVNAIGFMVSDKKAGPFKLVIESIKVERATK